MNKNKGFSLIEVIFYLLLFSLLIFGLVEMGIFLVKESQITVARNDLVATASRVLTDVTREMRLGQNLTDANLGQQYSVLAFDDIQGNAVRVWRNAETGVLQMDKNGERNLHSDDLTVQEFFVQRLNPANTREIYRVRLTFSNWGGEAFSLETAVNFN